jgi:hypothetical protein
MKQLDTRSLMAKLFCIILLFSFTAQVNIHAETSNAKSGKTKYTIPQMPAYQYPTEEVNIANSAHRSEERRVGKECRL